MFDEDGYFYRAKRVQKSPSRPGVYLYPENSTVKPPELDGKHFAQWDKATQTWIYELIPQSIEDFINVSVSHTSQTERNCLLRSLIQRFAEGSDKYRIARGDDLSWSIEPIPEPTELDIKQAEISQLKGQLASTDYVVTKISEGVATSEEYSSVLADRKMWRARINELESEIKRLDA